MGVRGQEGVDERLGAGHPVDGHRLAVLRWIATAPVALCQAIAVPMAVARPMPNLIVMTAAFAIGARHGMAAGRARAVEIDPETALVIAPQIDSESVQEIDPEIAPESDPEIDSESVQEIAPESGLEIAPVPSIEIRAPSDQTLRTIAQGPGVFVIEMIVTAIAVAPGMNGVNHPSAPDPVTRLAAPSAWMSHRRPQRPSPQLMI